MLTCEKRAAPGNSPLGHLTSHNHPNFVKSIPRLIFLAVGAVWLNGCAVYVPTVPATPLLEKGQVEVTAGLRSFRSGELGAAWSPVPHLLVTGEVAGDLGRTSTTVTTPQGPVTYLDTHRQGSFGLGYYRAPAGAAGSYVALLGGVGVGRTVFFALDDYEATSPYLPFPLPTRSGVYDARYRRYYGQVYYARPAFIGDLKGGFSLRTVWLDYIRLTYDNQPVAPSNRVFLEPTVFVRSDHGPLRYYATAGLSAPLSSDRNNPANGRTATWSLLVSGGIILRPDLLRKHRE